MIGLFFFMKSVGMWRDYIWRGNTGNTTSSHYLQLLCSVKSPGTLNS